jgi:YbgC/YbaW family acyl-CoA thioester hydrolase
MEKQPHSYYTIRFSDCDPFGHLNNARYIDYFLNAREDHLKSAYDMDLNQFYKQGLTWFVGSHEIAYLRPADYNEKVKITSALLEAGHDFLLVEMTMTDAADSHLKSIMHTRFIPVGLKSGKRENHPDTFLDFANSVTTGWQRSSFVERTKHLQLTIKTATI